MVFPRIARPRRRFTSGLKKGVTREKFEKAIGTPELLPRLLGALHPEQSDAMFLPSGRVHAIGGGNVILEIQQNSDTTYRVDDWGRVDDQGRPRTLHREQALEPRSASTISSRSSSSRTASAFCNAPFSPSSAPLSILENTASGPATRPASSITSLRRAASKLTTRQIKRGTKAGSFPPVRIAYNLEPISAKALN